MTGDRRAFRRPEEVAHLRAALVEAGVTSIDETPPRRDVLSWFRRRRASLQPTTVDQLNAVAHLTESIAGTAYDLAMEGRTRDQVVAAAIAATARMVEQQP